MSVAFTREEDVEAAAAHLPDRPISPHPNLVTPEGLKALDSALAVAQAAYSAAKAGGDISTDRSAMAAAARDLRYYAARRASAQLVQPKVGGVRVQFGGSVTFVRDGGKCQTFSIVGEDEADVARGSVSHVSPLARALLGKSVGDVAEVAGHEVEIVALEAGAATDADQQG